MDLVCGSYESPPDGVSCCHGDWRLSGSGDLEGTLQSRSKPSLSPANKLSRISARNVTDLRLGTNLLGVNISITVYLYSDIVNNSSS